MKGTIKYILLFVLVFFIFFDAKPQKPIADENKKTRFLFVFDASQSMFGLWNYQQKIFAARNILSIFLDSLETKPNIELGLRVFGDQYYVPPQVCEDSRLLVPFGPDNTKKIKSALKSIVPKGTTPITYALQQAANDFPPCDDCRNFIILITDGIEECGGDPCEVSIEFQSKGIILKPFVIGLGQEFEGQYDCVGTFIEAPTEEDFEDGLYIMITQAMNTTSAQINLLDINNKPTTTNVSVSILDHDTKILHYQFIHTLNAYGIPDTVYLEPRNVYDIIAHTIPEVRVDSVVIDEAIHNTIALKAPVGTLSLNLDSREQVSGMQVLVRQQNKPETLNVQSLSQSEIYLTGYYQLEVLSLPRLLIDSVLVSQNHITNVDIPAPGILVIKKPGLGYGSILKHNKEGLEWVYTLRNDVNHIESMYLLPGNYQVVFRTKFSNSTASSIKKSFEIKSGSTLTLDLTKL